jgi:hypothetical protein
MFVSQEEQTKGIKKKENSQIYITNKFTWAKEKFISTVLWFGSFTHNRGVIHFLNNTNYPQRKNTQEYIAFRL